MGLIQMLKSNSGKILGIARVESFHPIVQEGEGEDPVVRPLLGEVRAAELGKHPVPEEDFVAAHHEAGFFAEEPDLLRSRCRPERFAQNPWMPEGFVIFKQNLFRNHPFARRSKSIVDQPVRL